MGKLDSRIAIVTGAKQGIGKAVADKLEAEGATVVGADIQSGTTIRADVSSEDSERLRGSRHRPQQRLSAGLRRESGRAEREGRCPG